MSAVADRDASPRWLDYLTLDKMRGKGHISKDEHRLLMDFVDYISTLVGDKTYEVDPLREQLADPPVVDPIMYTHVVSDQMLLTAVTDPRIQQILLDTYPARVNRDRIEALRLVLRRLMRE